MKNKNDLIVFNRPFMTGRELQYISQAYSNGSLSGDGLHTKLCHDWLERNFNCSKALLTHSCTAALEMVALLLDLKPGDEVIMPSYTFVSTANAFVLRGAVPVFVDIRADTLNIDENLIESAITSKTKAIIVVHYAGVACEMDSITLLAKKYCLAVIEDAAHGVMAKYKGRPLGSIGQFGAYSFHETKNIICGEGGALIVNDPTYVLQAEIIREKGTNRSSFFRGESDKYTWQSVGSSYLPGEITAAFLLAQLESAEFLTSKRIQIWNYYHRLLEQLELKGLLRRPIIPKHCFHNAHMYYILLAEGVDRQYVIESLKSFGILTVFHYVPLHSSPAGKRVGRAHQTLEHTNRESERILRLPLWIELTERQQEFIAEKLTNILLV
jgi:dTDP-4-amino-4,6-dideoxygalactose transaminase